jgi:hypothetical protein
MDRSDHEEQWGKGELGSAKGIEEITRPKITCMAVRKQAAISPSIAS